MKMMMINEEEEEEEGRSKEEELSRPQRAVNVSNEAGKCEGR